MNKLVAPPPVSQRRRALLASMAGFSTLGTALATTGCGGTASDTAILRLMNGTVDYTTADFWIEGVRVYVGLANGGTTSTYGSVDSGSLQIELHAAGSSTAKLTDTHEFDANSYASVLALGSIADGLSFRYLDESNTSAAAGAFKLRCLQGMASLGALDVYLANSSSLSGLTPTLSVASYGALSDFVSLGSGTYRVRVTRAGDQSAVLFDFPAGLAVSGTTVLTLAIVPRSSGSLPNITVLPERSTHVVLSNSLA